MTTFDQNLAALNHGYARLPLARVSVGCGNGLHISLGTYNPYPEPFIGIWVYCCDWVLFQHDQVVVESNADTDHVISRVAGLKGSRFLTIDAEYGGRGISRFRFDGGWCLTTSPYRNYQSLDEQWLCFEGTKVYTYLFPPGEIAVEDR